MPAPRVSRLFRPAAFVALVLVFLAIGGGASAAPDDDGVFRQLHTKSGIIGCQYASGGSLPRALLRCDISGRLRPRPPRPASCAPNPDFELVWAVGIVLQTTGRAQIVCAGDTTLGARGRLLRRGSLFRAGGIACQSLAAQTLICENAHGHGFVLSPRRWHIY